MRCSFEKYIRKPIIFTLTLVCIFNICPPVLLSLEEPNLISPSAVLVEESTGQLLYEKEANEPRHCASITKIMTVLLVIEALARKEINLKDKVTATKHAQSMGGSQIWLKAGESMSVDELLKAVMISSANDAAVALAEHICGSEEDFVKAMNKRAKELKMLNTNFKNCTGLDEEGHLTTASDIAIMARELIKHGDIFKYTKVWMDYLRGEKTQLVNTNKLIKSYKGITGLKTGTTDDAGCCICATAKRKDVGLISVILGAENSDDRFNDAANLLDYGFNNFIKVTPKIDNIHLAPVKVKKGLRKEVELEIANVKSFLIPIDNENEIKTVLELKDEVLAPVSRGQVFGKLTYKLNDKDIISFNIVAKDECKKATFKNIFKTMLYFIFGGN